MGGNWKCNPATVREANTLLKEWKKMLGRHVAWQGEAWPQGADINPQFNRPQHVSATLDCYAFCNRASKI